MLPQAVPLPAPPILFRSFDPDPPPPPGRHSGSIFNSNISRTAKESKCKKPVPKSPPPSRTFPFFFLRHPLFKHGETNFFTIHPPSPLIPLGEGDVTKKESLHRSLSFVFVPCPLFGVENPSRPESPSPLHLQIFSAKLPFLPPFFYLPPLRNHIILEQLMPYRTTLDVPAYSHFYKS